MNRPMTRNLNSAAPSASGDSFPEVLVELKPMVARNHLGWIKAHPKSTLGDLRDYMLGVRDEMEGCNDDELVDGLCGDAGDYCATFGEDDVTVGHRLANVEDDITLIEKMIGKVGEQYKVRSLLKETANSHLEEPLTENQKRYVEFLLKRVLGVPLWSRKELLDGPWQPWLKKRLQRLLG